MITTSYHRVCSTLLSSWSSLLLSRTALLSSIDYHHTLIRDNDFDPSQFYRVHIWVSPQKGESINVGFSMDPALLIRQPVCDERPHFPMIEHRRYKLSQAFSFVSFTSHGKTTLVHISYRYTRQLKSAIYIHVSSKTQVSIATTQPSECHRLSFCFSKQIAFWNSVKMVETHYVCMWLFGQINICHQTSN